jgi:hypothetical protein
MLRRGLAAAPLAARLSRRGFLSLAFRSAVVALVAVAGAPATVTADPAPIWYAELEEEEPPYASAAAARAAAALA